MIGNITTLATIAHYALGSAETATIRRIAVGAVTVSCNSNKKINFQTKLSTLVFKVQLTLARRTSTAVGRITKISLGTLFAVVTFKGEIK